MEWTWHEAFWYMAITKYPLFAKMYPHCAAISQSGLEAWDIVTRPLKKSNLWFFIQFSFTCPKYQCWYFWFSLKWPELYLFFLTSNHLSKFQSKLWFTLFIFFCKTNSNHFLHSVWLIEIEGFYHHKSWFLDCHD